MTVLIASSFTKPLDRLTGQEQSQAKISAFDIQQNPDSPGLSLHRIDRARDPDFWSARVNRDLRIVLHKRAGDTLLAYVGHHDDAYAWAERRRLDRHPRTGAAQIVEIRETVQEIVTHRYIEEEVPKPPLFAAETDDTLLSWGVPHDWLDTVREATEDTVLDIASHLPDEAQEAVLAAAVGEAPTVRIVEEPDGAGFAHPDAQRRFRVIGDEAELAAALNAPWDEWAVFLHPAQREFVDRDFNGPARVIGSAGTGKTVVALHRAVRLASESPENRVLLTTFSADLAAGLAEKMARLTQGRPGLASRISVKTLPDVARELATKRFGGARLISDQQVEECLHAAADAEQTMVDCSFLEDEWRLIVDAWDVRDAERYLSLPRLGRKVRMAASRRDEVWRVFSRVRNWLEAEDLETEAGLMHRLSRELVDAPYTHVVVDEAQDISVPELHLVAAMACDTTNGLFFAGDIGQRIFRSPFPWKSAGIDVQGRSRSLKVNYRTSHQIRSNELEGLATPAAFAAWLAPLRKVEWVVYAKPPFGGPEAVLAYLSRYTHRVAISNSRLVSADADAVAFRWKDYRIKNRDRQKVMRLATGEFIRRFLLHVLPDGFHRIRHYGLLAGNGRRRNIETIRDLLAAEPAAEARTTDADAALPLTLREPCPDCGGPMRIVETFRRGERPKTRAPPRRAAA